MLIKSKYKIARRLGSPIFEKTQGQKYALREGRRKPAARKHPRTITDYGKQLTEKQKLRYTYLLNERQLKKYVTRVLEKKGGKQDEKLYETLESRLDNIVYRLGWAPTRLAVRQLVSHGHITLNNRRVNVPSHVVSIGDKVAIRAGSIAKKPFAGLEEKIKGVQTPNWLKSDLAKKEATMQGMPKLVPTEAPVDFTMVLEYYKR